MSLEWNGIDNWEYVKFEPAEPVDWLLRRNVVGLSPQTVARFIAKVKIVPGSCWLWIGARFPTGYGMFNLGRTDDGKQITGYTHRIAYELAFGPLESLQANHHCDTPACCNPGPGHIYAGTQKDNLRDRTERQRYPAEVPARWRGWPSPDLRRRLIAECLASRKHGTIAKLAREHNIRFSKLYAAVARARQREFDAATTGAASAVR